MGTSVTPEAEPPQEEEADANLDQEEEPLAVETEDAAEESGEESGEDPTLPNPQMAFNADEYGGAGSDRMDD